MPETTPAETLRKAAALMRKLASEATPGPWERPLDTRHKNAVIAALPEDEDPRQWQGGVIPAEFASHNGPMGRYAGQRERVGVVSADIWSTGGFIRKRSGRDLEFIASMHPLVGLALAGLLDDSAAYYEGLSANEAAFVAAALGGDVDPGLKLARLFLGEVSDA
jgi:hypothetical protein